MEQDRRTRGAHDAAGSWELRGLREERGAALRTLPEVLEGVVESASGAPAVRERASRWPWAVGAAAAGAAAGAAVVLLVRRVVGEDAPGAQEPDQLLAVVDPLPPGPSA